MPQLTRREQILAVSLLLAFLVGFGIKHYREKEAIHQVAGQFIKK